MVDSIFAGEQFFRFFAGDLAAVAIGHDLHVLVFQSVKSPDDKRQDKAYRGEDDIGEPQAVEGVGGLRVAGDGVSLGEFFKALHAVFGDFEAEHGKQCKSERAGDDGGAEGPPLIQKKDPPRSKNRYTVDRNRSNSKAADYRS